MYRKKAYFNILFMEKKSNYTISPINKKLVMLFLSSFFLSGKVNV